jgi:hypothetical protein
MLAHKIITNESQNRDFNIENSVRPSLNVEISYTISFITVHNLFQSKNS